VGEPPNITRSALPSYCDIAAVPSHTTTRAYTRAHTPARDANLSSEGSSNNARNDDRAKHGGEVTEEPESTW
jgi:hypothetical protein